VAKVAEFFDLGSSEITLGNGVNDFAVGFTDALGVQSIVFQNAHDGVCAQKNRG
jgi:hypothetical protein